MKRFIRKLEEALERPELPEKDKWEGIDPYTAQMIEKENELVKGAAAILNCEYELGNFASSSAIFYKGDQIQVYYERDSNESVIPNPKLLVHGGWVSDELESDPDIYEDTPIGVAEAVKRGYERKKADIPAPGSIDDMIKKLESGNL